MELIAERHFYLYAKMHYQRTSTMKDLKKILCKYTGLSKVSDKDVFSFVFDLAKLHMKPYQWSEAIEHTFFPMFMFKKGTTAKSRFLDKMISVLSLTKVVDNKGNKVLNLGKPDPDILPLRKKD